MATVHYSEARWKGDLKSGQGSLKFGSGAFEGPYSFISRTQENNSQTNPEELIAAAHSGCFSMALAAMLSKAGHIPEDIFTTAKVYLDMKDQNLVISLIELETEVRVEGFSEKEFLDIAENAKTNCPVSQALSAVKINFKAKLL